MPSNESHSGSNNNEDCSAFSLLEQQQVPQQQHRILSGSQENLLTSLDPCGTESDPNVFVALYDFHSGGENQLTIRKGTLQQQVCHTQCMSRCSPKGKHDE